MTLIIEDGTGVSGANSYASVAEARAYASARGLTLPATDGAVEVLLVQACDMLQSLEPRYKGARVTDTQELAWPRQSVYLFGSSAPLGTTSIPAILKQAQCQLAFDASQTTLQPTGEGRQVIEKQTDVLITKWSDTRASTIQPVFNKAMGILAPLLRSMSVLSTLRV